MNKEKKVLLLQIFLFIVTFCTTTLAGAEWIYGRYFFLNDDGFGWNKWLSSEKILFSLNFSVPFLIILTAHEMGHYVVAKWYKIKVTLPYYIPFWFGLSSSIGTMGAFIRIKQRIASRKEFFDVGIAGPLTGFVFACGFLYYGFTHLPPATYIFSIHPEYEKFGLDYARYVYKEMEGNFYLGSNLLFYFFETYIADHSLVPNKYEMMHYPIIFAGFLSCFFTALNLIPIGQLDGGHILYGLIGLKNHRMVSLVLYIAFVFYAGLGLIRAADIATGSLLPPTLYMFFLLTIFVKIFGNFKSAFLASFGIFTLQIGVTYFFPSVQGYSGWLLFAFILGRFLGIFHPGARIDTPLDGKRKVLGIVSLVIFVICFSPTPFVFE